MGTDFDFSKFRKTEPPIFHPDRLRGLMVTEWYILLRWKAVKWLRNWSIFCGSNLVLSISWQAGCSFHRSIHHRAGTVTACLKHCNLFWEQFDSWNLCGWVVVVMPKSPTYPSCHTAVAGKEKTTPSRPLMHKQLQAPVLIGCVRMVVINSI
mgnify:CR=1 FL=1